MTDAKFNKVLKIAEIAKLSREEAIKYNVNRTQYAEIKGMSDAAYADGHQDASEKYEVLLEEARKKAEQADKKSEQERAKAEQERNDKEKLQKEKEALVRLLISSGISKESVAAANQITLAELEKILRV